MSTAIALQPVTWQRMAKGIDGVRQRLERAVMALAKFGVRYAVGGESAVAAWVSRVDESAVRNTRDVDILLRREDAEKARAALEAAGFVHRRVASLGKAGAMDVFLDGPDAKVRDAVHVLWAGEKPVPDAIEKTPELRVFEVHAQPLKPEEQEAWMKQRKQDSLGVEELIPATSDLIATLPEGDAKDAVKVPSSGPLLVELRYPALAQSALVTQQPKHP